MKCLDSGWVLRHQYLAGELESGHPDELRERLTNWLAEANDPTGPLPPSVAPSEWAVRNFIDTWRKPVRLGVDSFEASLIMALEALKAGNTDATVFEIECSLQTLAEDVRDELGLYEWNRED